MCLTRASTRPSAWSEISTMPAAALIRLNVTVHRRRHPNGASGLAPGGRGILKDEVLDQQYLVAIETAVLVDTRIDDLFEVAANERMRAPVWVLGTLDHAIFHPDAPVGPRMVGHEALERVDDFVQLDPPRVRA